MNPSRVSSAILLAVALHAGAVEPVARVHWEAETSSPKPAAVRVARGASLALQARLRSYGRAIELPSDAAATFCWQTNGMGSSWWTKAASATTNGTLRAEWTPDMDAGATAYAFFLRVETGGGIDYSARGALTVEESPGLAPESAGDAPGTNRWEALALSGTALAAAEPVALVRWDAETSNPRPFAVRTLRGESIALEAQLVTYGKRAELPAGAAAVFCYQTNGMGSAWWTAPASARSDGLLRAVWTPQLDAGAWEYSFFFRVESSEGLDYSAHGGLRLFPSPGAAPNQIDFPVQRLDFSAISYTNAPWATAADARTAAAAVVYEAIRELDASTAETIDDTHALLLDLIDALRSIPTQQGTTP